MSARTLSIKRSKSKWHHLKLPQTLANREGCLRVGLWCQLHLPIATASVEGAEPGGASNVIQGIINSWQRIRVLACDII